VSSVLQRFEDPDGFVGYRSPLLAALRVPHVFTTRHGGLGEPRERTARAAGLAGARAVTVTQVHGARVLELGSETLPSPDSEADALVSTRRDLFVAVHTADCVPVLLASRDGTRVAAVHAGWRGLVAGVLPRTLERFGAASPVAAIGPCLSRAHFEVGPEVVEAFRAAELGSTVVERPDRRACIDLVLAARLQLERGGVRELDAAALCTYELEEEFYSHRRDVTHRGGSHTGRLNAWIAARARD
jgi:hypothetical protein